MEHNITKELPYGIQDFVTIAEQNIYYVDKTMYYDFASSFFALSSLSYR